MLISGAPISDNSISSAPKLLVYTPLFPDDISMGLMGGCGWKTAIAVTAAGGEYRRAKWSLSLGSWIAPKRLRSPSTMAQTTDLHRVLKGGQGEFRFRDWTDYTVNSGEGVLINFGAHVQLAKAYTLVDVFGSPHTVYRPIFKPRSPTVVFSPTGPTVDYNTGIVLGGTVGVTTWTGQFEVPARFGDDRPEVTFKQAGALGWDSIQILETRFDPSDPV